MFEVVRSQKLRFAVHFRILLSVIPLWIAANLWTYFTTGVRQAFAQDPYLVVGGMFFFLMDFWTAVIYKIWIRAEARFSSAGLATGAKKLGLWVVIGAGATIWANSFPNDPKGVRWYDPRWLGANLDLLGFLYMYAIDTVSSIENVTGKRIGDTRIGAFMRSILAHYFPDMEQDISEMRTEEGKN